MNKLQKRLLVQSKKTNRLTFLGNTLYIKGDYQFWEHEETGELWRRKFNVEDKHGEWEKVTSHS